MIALWIVLAVVTLGILSLMLCDLFGLCPQCGVIVDAQPHKQGCRRAAR